MPFINAYSISNLKKYIFIRCRMTCTRILQTYEQLKHVYIYIYIYCFMHDGHSYLQRLCFLFMMQRPSGHSLLPGLKTCAYYFATFIFLYIYIQESFILCTSIPCICVLYLSVNQVDRKNNSQQRHIVIHVAF